MSRKSDGKVVFGEWLPDLPEYDNPGLTEAKNVIPTSASYVPYLPLSTMGDALSARPQGAISVLDSTGNSLLYAGTATDLYQRAGTGWTDKSTAVAYTLTDEDYWRFVQFDEILVATSYVDLPQKITIGDAGNFDDLADTGTAPSARHVGVIGRFVVLGNTNDATNGVVPSRIQWCAIDDATNWPTPGSASALATQAGEQFLNAGGGPVTGIVGGEQVGIIFQRSSITRVTYVGGNVVFQFDTFERARGNLLPNAISQVGNEVYFRSSDGFYKTDGVTVTPIGSRKVDNYFLNDFDSTAPHRVYSAVDFDKKVIRWSYPGDGNTSGRPNKVLMYNYEENRWARAEDDIECMIGGLTIATSLDDLDDFFPSIDDVTPPLDSPFWAGGNNTLFGFGSTHKIGTFAGTAGTAEIIGQEVELNPGLYTRVQGVKPIVLGSGVVLTVGLGQRDNVSDAISYTSQTSPTARTGFCDFDLEARYSRARLRIEGTFTQATGIQYQQVPGGAA